jgi:hypothetical protein
LGLAYRDIEKRQAWFRRRYRRRHEWEFERARAYRESNRRTLRRRQKAWVRLKLLEDPFWRCRIALQRRLEAEVPAQRGLSQ